MNYGEIKSNIISLGFADNDDWEEYEELHYTYDCINRAISIINSDFPHIASKEFEIDDKDFGVVYIDMSQEEGFLDLYGSPAVIRKDGASLSVSPQEGSELTDEVCAISSKEYLAKTKYSSKFTYDGTAWTKGAEEVDLDDYGITIEDVTLAEGDVLNVKVGEYYSKFGDYDIEMGHTLLIDADEHKGIFRVYYKSACTTIDEETEDTFVPELPLKVHHLVPLLASYYLWLEDMPTQAQMYYNEYSAEMQTIVSEADKPKGKVMVNWRGI